MNHFAEEWRAYSTVRERVTAARHSALVRAVRRHKGSVARHYAAMRWLGRQLAQYGRHLQERYATP